MRYIWYVRSCYVNGSVSSVYTLRGRSISSDQNVCSMSGRLERGDITSKEVSEDADYVINGVSGGWCDLYVLR